MTNACTTERRLQSKLHELVYGKRPTGPAHRIATRSYKQINPSKLQLDRLYNISSDGATFVMNRMMLVKIDSWVSRLEGEIYYPLHQCTMHGYAFKFS